MGFRTVVMLSNDHAHEWECDAELGKKIALSMNSKKRIGDYGQVVQCVHADTQTIAVLDGYTFFTELAGKHWSLGESAENMRLRLLKQAAEAMGYRLVKRRKPKS